MAVNPPPAQVPPGTQSLVQPTQQAPGQSPGIQSQQLGALVGQGYTGAQLLEPYTTLQQAYLQPLTQQPKVAPPQIDDPTLAAIQQRLQAIQQSDPVLNGSQLPHPKSVLAKHMTPAEMAAQVGTQTWQQMVTQPFHDFIDTWKRDPKMGLAETAGGLALVGGIVGLEAITGGAATPFIFAASAALVAPGMISAWSEEMRNPTDQNLVKALVNTSTGVLSVGVPTKYFAGATNARALLSDVMKQKRMVSTLGEATDLLLPIRTRDQIRVGVPLSRQLETLASDFEGLQKQLSARGVEGTEPAQDLLRHTATVQKLSQNVVDSGGDPEAVAVLKEYVTNTLNPARLQVAAQHLFLPNNPYTHVPLTPIEGVPTELYDAINPLKNAMVARVHRLATGHGVDSLREGIASVLETQALRRSGGAARSSAQALQTSLRDLRAASGVGTDEVEKVLQGLEEPELWKELAPHEQAYGQALRDVFDSMTAAEMRHGTISLALAGRMPRFSQGVQTEGATSPALQIVNWLKGTTRDTHRTWQASIDLATGEVESRAQTRRQWAEAPVQAQKEYEQYAPQRQALAVHGEAIRKGRRQVGGFKAAITRAEKAGRDTAAAQEKLDKFIADFQAEHGDVAHGLLTGSGRDLARAESRRPAVTERILGQDALDVAIGAHLNRMHMATIRQDLETMANLAPLKGVFGKLPEKFWGVAMHQPEFQGKFEKPAIVPETFFVGDGKASPEANANGLGYALIHPAIGTPKDIHYRPALYALNDMPVGKDGLKPPSLAMQILKAGTDAADSTEYQQTVARAITGVVSTSKRFIMGSPAWHAMNVAGRAIAFVLNDPAVAGSAFKAVRAMHADPALYAHVDEEFALAGGVRANRFEIGDHLRRLQKEEDGQYTWPGLLRNFERPLAHAYGDLIEGGFWKAVHDTQLAAYVYAKQSLRDGLGADHPEQEIQKLAAQYANNLGGMVNPLYMSRLYRHMRNIVWFAPSYWATFMRSVASAFPGAARISKLTAERDGGRFVRFGAVPLKAISDRGRTELVRAQRDWFLTYLMTAAASADMLNVILGGRHMWDNDQGRMFDINIDKVGQPISGIPLVGGLISPGGPVATKSGPKHTYISSLPLFRQAADVANALGLGHDWGFAHQFSDQTWQQQDAAHKAMLLAGGLLDGIRRQGATKTGGILQAGYAGLAGEDLSARLGKGINQRVDRTAALASLVPGGYAIQQAVTDVSAPGGAQRSLGQDAQAVGQSLLTQFTGIPSIYHMGAERSPIDDSQFQKWITQRNQIHDQMAGASKALFAGTIQPIQYQRQKQQALDRMDQLNQDIFGSDSTAASLSAERRQLSQQYGLNEPGLSDAEWYARYDAYTNAWNQSLQAASPEVRALWWENNTAQWTDADYLEWEAKQLRDSLAASVDGQGGNYIKAYQNMLSQNRPLLSTAEYTALEQSDPYYSAYKTLLSQLGSSSVLGAFVSAFSSPFSQTYVTPPGLTEADAQAIAQATGHVAVRPESAQLQADKAKQVAHEQAVAQAGGQAAASPAYQQEVAGDIQAAQEQG